MSFKSLQNVFMAEEQSNDTDPTATSPEEQTQDVSLILNFFRTGRVGEKTTNVTSVHELEKQPSKTSKK